jgi:Glycoside hydrolase family 44
MGAALVGRWGSAAGGGLRYYILDNEPSLWRSTHRDVRADGRNDGRHQRG